MRRIFESMLLLRKEQKGAVKILVALSLFMLIGFTAFVVDVGSLYYEKSSLQKSLDAAVLGGAQLLKVSGAEAKAVAIDLASQNGFVVSEDEVETGENFIQITKTVTKDLFFARVLGFNQTDVSAFARAEMLTLIAGDGIIPVALEQGEYKQGEPYTMHFEAGNPDNASVKGNFGFLAIDGPGGNDLREGIINGSTREINEEFEWTKTGLSWGNVKKGFNERIKNDKDNTDCHNYQTADETCSRVVIVPMVETFAGANGKTMVRIVGFASFWIEGVEEGQNKAVVGRFIDTFPSGTFGPGKNYGIYGVKLVK